MRSLADYYLELCGPYLPVELKHYGSAKGAKAGSSEMGRTLESGPFLVIFVQQGTVAVGAAIEKHFDVTGIYEVRRIIVPARKDFFHLIVTHAREMGSVKPAREKANVQTALLFQ